MAGRGPLRFLAPLALVVVFVALVIVVASSGDGTEGDRGATTTAPAREAPRKRTYVVRRGDTLLAIAGRTGVPAATLRALNPTLDPQVLTPGQRLKLRR